MIANSLSQAFKENLGCQRSVQSIAFAAYNKSV